MHRIRSLLIGPALLVLLVVTVGQTADKAGSPAPAAKSPPPQADHPAATPAPTKTDATRPAMQSTAEQVMTDLLKRRTENPLIEPVNPQTGGANTPPAAATDGSTATPGSATVIGSAPALHAGPLMREGSFVINRRGRVIRSANQRAAWMFVFDSDKDGLHDPPMYLMPCKMLEDMEKLVARHEKTLAFILSGQVFVYHKANYLLVTRMMIAPRRGNLQP